MKLKGREKVFWWHFGHITHSKDIPTALPGISSVDSGHGDDDLDMLTAKVTSIEEIYLKSTHVTDEGIQYLSRIQNLKRLTVKKQDTITPACIPYLNALTGLEYLDINKTQIHLDDLPLLAPLVQLKELYVTSQNIDTEYLLEHVIRMKEILPGCVLFINYEAYE